LTLQTMESVPQVCIKVLANSVNPFSDLSHTVKCLNNFNIFTKIINFAFMRTWNGADSLLASYMKSMLEVARDRIILMVAMVCNLPPMIESVGVYTGKLSVSR